MWKSAKSTAVNFGLILGIVITAILLIVYMVNPELFLSPWIGIIIILLIIIFGIISSVKVKFSQNGIISLKETFTAYFITVAIGSLFSVIITFLLLSVFDPETGYMLNEKLIEMSAKTMQSVGRPEAEIKKMIEEAKNQNSFSLGKQLRTYFSRLVIYCIFGLISSFALRREEPKTT